MNNDIINNLIEIDKKARKIVEEAEKKAEAILASVDIEENDFISKYHNRAEKKLGVIREEESRNLKASCQEIKDSYEILINKLEKSYAENHENLEKIIFNKVINEISS